MPCLQPSLSLLFPVPIAVVSCLLLGPCLLFYGLGIRHGLQRGNHQNPCANRGKKEKQHEGAGRRGDGVWSLPATFPSFETRATAQEAEAGGADHALSSPPRACLGTPCPLPGLAMGAGLLGFIGRWLALHGALSASMRGGGLTLFDNGAGTTALYTLPTHTHLPAVMLQVSPHGGSSLCIPGQIDNSGPHERPSPFCRYLIAVSPPPGASPSMALLLISWSLAHGVRRRRLSTSCTTSTRRRRWSSSPTFRSW